MNNLLVYINDINKLNDYKKVGVSTFLFALQDYSVGYLNTYTIDEINDFDCTSFVLINRVLDCDSVDKLKNILPNIKVKGIIYEDIAVYNMVKELNLDLELICFQNHFNTNIGTINYWLDRVDSVMVCNELTKEEIINITNNAKKEVCVQIYGYNQAMYSRRLLLSNYQNEFNIDKNNTSLLTEKVTKIQFHAVENNYGTVLYSGNVFNGLELLKLNNIKYFYINSTLLDDNNIIEIIKNNKSNIGDSGFLYKETIYKLKEDK